MLRQWLSQLTQWGIVQWRYQRAWPCVWWCHCAEWAESEAASWWPRCSQPPRSLERQNSVFTNLDRSNTSNDTLKVQMSTQTAVQWKHFTVSVRKQQHQTVETSVRHLGDVGGAPADGLNGSCCKRLVLTLHIGLKKDQTLSVISKIAK